MNVKLLYQNKDWSPVRPYQDWQGIIKDLGLKTLFEAANQDSVVRTSRVVYSQHEDVFLGQAVRRVMGVPLETKEEVLYRHEIMRDCFRHEDFVGKLYVAASRILADWEKLGKKKNHTGVRDTKAELITDIRVLRLFVNGMEEIKSLMLENLDGLSSRGFLKLHERINEEFSQEAKTNLEKILGDLAFYVDTNVQKAQRGVYTMNVPRIQMDVGLLDGLKFTDLKLENVETKTENYSNPYGIKAKLQGQIGSISPNVIALYKNTALQEDAANLEYQAVNFVMTCCGGVLQSFGYFFEQLRFQIGFYLGVINIKNQMKRSGMEFCFPEASARGELQYDDLKEVVMGMEQGIKPVGNEGKLDGVLLTVITGANQGGKSTFLRSVGIAQVMLQSGMMVCAKHFRSGLYPGFFTHFTRREDSAMNSGRLDEELRRMDKIVSCLDDRSLLLLNESFATTTEKEGSAIAYDIVKALKEEGVRILTVTHLTSFAQRIYEESDGGKAGDVAFFSAERLEDGSRTFKMIPHAPEQTSFGLELYAEIMGK